MQTLWTRVAQVRVSCHCPQCLPSTSAVARRAAATATRRAPRLWTSSTLWYSGIFAVAATLDQGIKQQRREQWNKAIEDVKQDLARSDDAVANRDFLDSLEQETIATPDMREHLDSSPLRPHMPEWPVSTGQGRLPSKLPPQSIYTANRRKAKNMLNRWDPKKIERVQLSIDALQLEFFMELHRHGWHEEAASAVPSWYAEYILQPVEDTRKALAQKHMDLYDVFHMKGRYSLDLQDEQHANEEFARWQRSHGDEPLCNYVQDELGSFHNTAHDLNSSLRHLFDLGRKRVLSKPAMLAKVYHNLSVSSAPPNVDTFNTLIIGLSDVGTRRLVEDCIDCLQCTKIRYNEISLASILNHWTLNENGDEFQRWVELMRGNWGGLFLAQPGVQRTKSSQGRLVLKDEESPRVIQRPSPTPMVFNALINGVIKFSGFNAALRVWEAAREEGWGLAISGFHPLLKDCSRRRDWGAGLAIWKQITALRTTSEKPENRSDTSMRNTPVIDLPIFASMLQLCTRCNNRTAFQDVMGQAIAAHPRSATDLIRMVKLERSEMQASDQRIEPVANDIRTTVEEMNVSQYPNDLNNFRRQDMMHVKDEGSKATVASDSARNHLLEDAVPTRDEFQSSWLPIELQRRYRKSVMEKRKWWKEEHPWWEDKRKQWEDEREQGEGTPEGSNVVEPEQEQCHGEGFGESRGLFIQQPESYVMQQVQHLDEINELDQRTRHAVDATSIPDQLPSIYQPFSH